MMNRDSGLLRLPSFLLRLPSFLLAIAFILLLAALGGSGTARASDPLGFYFGASYGQAHVSAQQPDITITLNNGSVIPDALQSIYGGLGGTHSAFKGTLGIRPLSFLGAEVSYIDFGSVSTLVGQPVTLAPSPTAPSPFFVVNTEQTSQKGEAAFALLYLPVPVVDIYVKAGVSRITTDFRINYTEPSICYYFGCPPPAGPFTVTHDSTDTSFAYGAGLQWKLGKWAVRGEYERFSAAGENPSLLSFGMTYWFHME